MDNAGLVALNRQSGLLREMQAVANNIANLSTTGFRREGVVFAEHVADLEGSEPSLSMAEAAARVIDLSQGPLTQTGGAFDVAIEGEGMFMIAGPDGTEYTRAGNFTLSPEGELVTVEGLGVLDPGGAPIAVPLDLGAVRIARDGTVSAGETPVSQLGIARAADPGGLVHVAGTRFTIEGEAIAVDAPNVFQGFLEGSNVNPVEEIARMIQVQRAYEMGQRMMDQEDARIRSVIDLTGR
jgi:flagellar basal-body rod protein FlgF